jgi:hypothetical protein
MLLENEEMDIHDFIRQQQIEPRGEVQRLNMTDPSRPYYLLHDDVGDEDKIVDMWTLYQDDLEGRPISITSFSSRESARAWCQSHGLTLSDGGWR